MVERIEFRAPKRRIFKEARKCIEAKLILCSRRTLERQLE